MLEHEHQAWAAGARYVAGVDEAGRGPLAGPVVAAAVIADQAFLLTEEERLLQGLTDSKKLSATRRIHFYDLLTEHDAVLIGMGSATVEEIDEVNILQATYLAMRRAITNLPKKPDRLLVDGRPVPGLPAPSTAIVGGDGASLLIAAASVVAKVTRDRVMVELDGAHPEYGFARHKGYGTAAHREALRRHGPVACHRRSFAPVREACRREGA